MTKWWNKQESNLHPIYGLSPLQSLVAYPVPPAAFRKLLSHIQGANLGYYVLKVHSLIYKLLYAPFNYNISQKFQFVK